MARGVLVGRDAAVGSILGALMSGRVAAVRGAGGIGKTAVLHEVVERWGRPTVFAAGIDFLGHQRLLPLERSLGHPLIGDLEAVASDVRSERVPRLLAHEVRRRRRPSRRGARSPTRP